MERLGAEALRYNYALRSPFSDLLRWPASGNQISLFNDSNPALSTPSRSIRMISTRPIDIQCISVLLSIVVIVKHPCQAAPSRPLCSRHVPPLFRGVSALASSSLLTHAPIRRSPLSAVCATHLRDFPFSIFSFLLSSKSFEINTCMTSHKCTFQRTYKNAKTLRINTYKKQGGGVTRVVCEPRPGRGRSVPTLWGGSDVSEGPLTFGAI